MVWSALIAGMGTGVLVTFLQLMTTAPLIAQAESYERAVNPVNATPVAQPDHTHLHLPSPDGEHSRIPSHADWAPEDGFERTACTALSNVLAAVGYALLVAAGLSLVGAVGVRAGLALGAIGFVIFQLAPALGLPPRPPGVPTADLLARQEWWWATVMATALAFVCWYRARYASKRIWLPMGVTLIVLPHFIGAPQATADSAILPAELVRHFAAAAILISAFFWLMLGAGTGYLISKMRHYSERSPTVPRNRTINIQQ